MYLIQPEYKIKLVSDLLEVSGFLLVFQFPPPITLDYDITDILLIVVLNTQNT